MDNGSIKQNPFKRFRDKLRNAYAAASDSKPTQDQATARAKTERRSKHRKSSQSSVHIKADEKSFDEPKLLQNNNDLKQSDNNAQNVLSVEPVKKTSPDEIHVVSAIKSSDEHTLRNSKPLKPRRMKTALPANHSKPDKPEESMNRQKSAAKKENPSEKEQLTQFVQVDAAIKPAVSRSHKKKKKRRSKIDGETSPMSPAISPGADSSKKTDKDTDKYSSVDKETAKDMTSSKSRSKKKHKKRSQSSNDDDKKSPTPDGSLDKPHSEEKSNEKKLMRIHSAEMREFTGTVIDDKDKGTPVLKKASPKVEYRIEQKYVNGVLVKRFIPITEDAMHRQKTLDTVDQDHPQQPR